MINTQEIINNKYRVRPTKAFNFSDLSSKGGVWSPPQYNEPNINVNRLNKTIDMKTIKHTEALDLIIGKKGTTNREDFEWDIAKDKIEQYANQRVIEELEKLLENESNEWVDDEDGNEECGVRIVYSIRLRDRIKELKQ